MDCKFTATFGLEGSTVRPVNTRPKVEQIQNPACDGLILVVASATLGRGTADVVVGAGMTHNEPLMKLFPLRA